MRHSASAYRNGYCRCEICIADHRARQASERAARAARLLADPSLAQHGREHTYKNWRCRCALCTEANSRAVAERRRYQRERKAVGA